MSATLVLLDRRSSSSPPIGRPQPDSGHTEICLDREGGEPDWEGRAR